MKRPYRGPRQQVPNPGFSFLTSREIRGLKLEDEYERRAGEVEKPPDVPGLTDQSKRKTKIVERI